MRGAIAKILNYRKPAFWIIMFGLVTCLAVTICFATSPVRSEAKAGEGQKGELTSEDMTQKDGENAGMGRLSEEEVQQLMNENGATAFSEERWYFYAGNDAPGEMSNGRYPINFFIRFYPDGTDYWYETGISSFVGEGNYCIIGDELIIADKTYGTSDLISVHRFKMDGARLIFQENGSANFLFVKLKDGEEFLQEE